MRRLRRLIALLLATWIAAPSAAFAGVSINIAPPPLPVYAQPYAPGPDYIWAPGYWAYGDDDYYWVPGTWVEAPEAGLLWTPGYWSWRDGFYVWSAGYWGPHVGYYGGIDYGCGYGGSGYGGGRWDHGAFYYNTAVSHVNTSIIHNTYSKRIISHTAAGRASFNGGTGGTKARPTAKELEAAREHHVGPTSVQGQHEHSASGNHALLASVNHGAPAIAATAKAGVFTGDGVIGAKGPRTATVPPKGSNRRVSSLKTVSANDPKTFKATEPGHKQPALTAAIHKSNPTVATGHQVAKHTARVSRVGPAKIKQAAARRPAAKHASLKPPSKSKAQGGKKAKG